MYCFSPSFTFLFACTFLQFIYHFKSELEGAGGEGGGRGDRDGEHM